ncbi:MAG: hypothetical protein NC112_09110 [Oxalobacter formigenes]|nr:hypothetical protein [Oxalobacter formigenes]
MLNTQSFPPRHALPRVLTGNFIASLSAANAVMRLLKKKGYQVLSVSADRQAIRIKGETFRKMRRLQIVAGSHRYEGNLCLITLGGITVSWETDMKLTKGN